MPDNIESGVSRDEEIYEVEPRSCYDEAQRIAIQKLLTASIVCIVFMIVEVIAGVYSGSLALLSDATHLLSDICSFLVSLFAIWISTIQGSSSMSFGYHRAEIIGALVSVMIIWGVSGCLVYAAFQRLFHPPTVNGVIMFATATFGTLANLFMTQILHVHSHGIGSCPHDHGDTECGDLVSSQPDPRTVLISGPVDKDGNTYLQEQEPRPMHVYSSDVVNVNLRAAYLHALGDLLQNIGVMVAAGLIWWNPDWKIADPLCAFLFSIFVVLTTGSIIKDSVKVLMEGSPAGINLDSLTEDLLQIEHVLEVHDLHVWSLSVGKPALACHIVLEEESKAKIVLQKATALCQKSYGILHTTIQTDYSAHKSCCQTAAHQMCKF